MLVTTGNDGTATTPRYRVGRPPSLPLPLDFEPAVLPQTTPGGIIVDGMLDGDHDSTVTIEGLLAVPALGPVGVALLMGVIAVAAVWTLARART